MHSTVTRIENLSAEKRALLSSLLKNTSRVDPKAIPKRHREGGLPLSFAQQRMWFLAQLDPENPNYNVAGAIRISGRLNILLLEQCVNEVVRRHEVLRTTFSNVNGQTEQILSNNSRVPLAVLDLSDLPLPDKDAEQDKRIKRELQKPFVLAGTAPLLRMTLLLLKPQEFMLLLSMHHIASDEWSLRILISEIGQLYQTFIKGEPSLLPELAIQYADYASWQRSGLEGETRDKQLGYWLNLLADAPPRFRSAVGSAQTVYPDQSGGDLCDGFAADIRRRHYKAQQGTGYDLIYDVDGGFFPIAAPLHLSERCMHRLSRNE